MITLYTIAYNESLLIQFMIDHYRERFPGCRIVVYDNMSTDHTAKIALANGCKVIPFDTNNQIQDSCYLEIKNNCWKNALTDWVLICDTDELLDINEKQLSTEEDSGTSIIRSEGYDMVNMEDNLDIAGIKYGVRDPVYDKTCLLNKKFVGEINYTIGCHGCNPKGTITYSKNAYKLYHYLLINEKLTVEKFRTYASRLSPENLEHGWGSHYLMTLEDIHEDYTENRRVAVKMFGNTNDQNNT